MESMTTPIRQLTERLIKYSERQQILLQALRELTAEMVVEAAQNSSSGVAATADWVLESMLSPDIDARTNIGAEPGPLVCTPGSASPGAGSTDEVDPANEAEMESSTLACDEESWASSSHVLPGDAPVSSGPSCDVTMARGSEDPAVILVGVARDEVPESPVAEGRPAPTGKIRSSGAPPRQRRDYNYFADLEVELSELSKE